MARTKPGRYFYKMNFIRLIWLSFLLLSPGGSPAAVTFNGATTYQAIDGIGVNVNYRSWDGTNLQPVLNAFIDQAGMTLFRVVHDLSDWEATNDDTDSTTMNWNYYNGVYNSTEFNRLWDMFAYLNSRGVTNGAFFSFMGWGPAWMMNPDGRTLKAGQEDEWAETIASALIYARNTRGLKFGLVAPNNEPDIFHEGISIPTVAQYTNTLHRLAVKLDAHGMTNLSFVGPDRSAGGNAYMPEMTADPVIMARLKHFGVHSYSSGGGSTPEAYNWLKTSGYADRTLWTTEFNVWCTGCDTGTVGNYGWNYTRGTAEYLISHLLGGASAAFVWEGYDSIYAHHSMNWSYWGLLGVNNINAPAKTYTPRKHFYTVSQISKWVRPGAVRIGITGSTSPFTPLAAFKHDALGLVTLVGINPGSATALNGTLAGLPSVPRLALHYTSATTNLAFAGHAQVSNGAFAVTIPADCVFTLTGFAGVVLTNGVIRAGSNPGTGDLADRYQITLMNPVARAQFEVIAPTADVTLLVRKGLPPEGLADFDALSDNPETSSEMIVLRSGSTPTPVSAGEWFLTVMNTSGTNASYTVKVTQQNASGLPIILNAVSVASGQFCCSWNSLPGATYVVQSSDGSSNDSWMGETGTLVAQGFTTSACLPLQSAQRFFRIVEGVADNP